MELVIEKNDVIGRIEALTTANLRKRKDLVAIMRNVMATAKKVVQRNARESISNDPRAAYKAVRTLVYKKLIGGNVNIISPRNGKVTSRPYNYKGTLKSGQVGGNRMKRSARTESLQNYYGASRGFILRFLNDGTNGRTTRNPQGANRGVISGRHWFEAAGRIATQEAAEELDELLERLIQEVWNETV
ncbi:MAG: hypothetical protein LUC33_01605 [Prevotellaceae bacterium]|nr:hypothetical protein [Prevotellaceae bacterium]